jgi:hypothetical protein
MKKQKITDICFKKVKNFIGKLYEYFRIIAMDRRWFFGGDFWVARFNYLKKTSILKFMPWEKFEKSTKSDTPARTSKKKNCILIISKKSRIWKLSNNSVINFR